MLSALYGAASWANSLPRGLKQLLLPAFDVVTLSGCVWAAYSLRIGVFYAPQPIDWLIIFSAPLVALPVLAGHGLYRSVVRYLPEQAAWTVARGVFLATLVWVFGLFLLEIYRIGFVPRSVPVIYCVLSILAVGGSRFAAKYLLWEPVKSTYHGQILIYGAGAGSLQLANALQVGGAKLVAGFIDDDKSLHGRDIAGIKVYDPEHLPTVMATTGVDEVVISLSDIDRQKRQEIVATLTRHRAKIRSIPAISDLASGRYLVSQMREVDIGDVLGRSLVPPDPSLLKQMINDRVLLVTGAGGSIGSELCRQIVRWTPRKLVLLEANEFALYQIDRSLRKLTEAAIVPVLGSVTDGQLVRRTLKKESVHVVFHAAAHKHVPLVESNALEGVRNNVVGTKTIADAAFAEGVEDFVLISSDKAVRPTNVMGATKRWSELIVRQYADLAVAGDTGQRFSAVRFGNVLGSNGSVVPLFKEQIAEGGPVTVTDPEMTRFLMSIHEASELIVQAGMLSEGGDIFLLEMGAPVRIRDLAENMIRLAGLSVKGPDQLDGEIAIEIIGRRPGEKTHEELFYDPASVRPTIHPKILRASRGASEHASISPAYEELTTALTDEDELEVRRILFDLVRRHDIRDGRDKHAKIAGVEGRA